MIDWVNRLRAQFPKIGYKLSIFAGALAITTEIIRLVLFQFFHPSSICFPEPLSRVNLQAGSLILALTAFVFGSAQMICSELAKRGYIAFRPLTFLSSLPLVLYGYSLGLTIGFWTVGSFTGLWVPSPVGILIQIVFTAPFLVAGVGGDTNFVRTFFNILVILLVATKTKKTGTIARFFSIKNGGRCNGRSARTGNRN